MKLHLKSINNHAWKITKELYDISTAKEEKSDEMDKKKENNNLRVMNALYYALNESEYSRI